MRSMTTLALAAALLAGCSSSNSGDNGGGSGGSTPITATVNGSAFVGNTSPIAHYLGNALSFSAFNSDQSQEILITVTNVSGTGTFSFESALGGSVAEYETSATSSTPQWITGYNGGTGTITVSALTATGASGTFSFTGAASPGTGASGTATVTNGKFNVTF